MKRAETFAQLDAIDIPRFVGILREIYSNNPFSAQEIIENQVIPTADLPWRTKKILTNDPSNTKSAFHSLSTLFGHNSPACKRNTFRKTSGGWIIISDKQETVPCDKISVVKSTYESYITSKKWEVKRTEYWDTHGRWCKKCGTTQNLHVHHHTYERLFEELLTDLVGLCAACHEEVHLKHKAAGSSANLTRWTELVVGIILAPR